MVMVPTPGIEPGSTALQAAAMTTSAKLAYSLILVRCVGFEPTPLQILSLSTLPIGLPPHMVLLTRIELVSHPYQGCVLPFNYRSRYLVPRARLELAKFGF